nr:serine protease inhibitor 3/4-like isoform X4 [Megalopta genalis]
MRMLKESILVAFLIALAMGSPASRSDALRAVSQGTNDFSASLFQAVAQENPGNLIMSPLSAAVVLAMAAYGARGETEKQLKAVLHSPNPDKLAMHGYEELITSLNSVKENTLNLANKAFLNNKFSLKPTYQSLTENYFKSKTQLVDFAQSAQAANEINSWVSDKTNNHIKDLIGSGDVDADTALVLVNAVYFKGLWKDKFDPAATQSLPFHVNGNTVKNVPTMHRQDHYKYGELPELNAKFIEIPYKGDSLSMVIILPNEVNGLAEVEKKVHSINLSDVLSQGIVQEVQLYLPKFKIESKLDLNSPLKKLGLTDMFSSHANFSGIADAELVVSKVVQKAFIEVNEEGSEAAAATAILFSLTSSSYQPIPRMEIDKPFVYTIIHKSQNSEGKAIPTVLFSGRVTDPSI